MILVLGGGFGLYGHLAALAGAGAPVATMQRYREQAEARPELASLLDRIAWHADEDAALDEAATTVLARRPADNATLVARLLAKGVGGDLVIEKPVAPTPDLADALVAGLVARGRRWAVPYLFGHTDWGRATLDALDRGRAARIDWTHRANPGGWKADAACGGGALAFYLIHALALAVEGLPGATIVGRRDADGGITLTADDRLTIRFALGPALRFAADWETGHYGAPGPFGSAPMRGHPDPRIPVLRRFYRAVDAGHRPAPAFHRAVHGHWRGLADLL